MKRTLLFVDDEPHLLEGLKLSYRNSGFRILVATSAEQALEILGRLVIDAVITDDKMPKISGTRLLARVRDIQPSAVRILFTGRPDVGSALHAINEAAVHRYLTKPCRPKALLEHIAQALAERDAKAISEEVRLSEAPEARVEG